MVSPRTPVLIAAAQASRADEMSPMGLAAAAGAAALAQADGVADRIDALSVVRSFADSGMGAPFGGPSDPPLAVARRLGLSPRRRIHPSVGGDTPLRLIGLHAEAIMAGASDAALIVSGEAMRTQARAARAGEALDWREDHDGEPSEPAFEDADGFSPAEAAHGLALPVHAYALMETALAARLGRSLPDHRAAISRLWSQMSARAAANPLARTDELWTPDAVAAPSPDNRMIAAPYTKRLCANPSVDLGGAVLMASEGLADALGVPQSRRVYLHGAAAAQEVWHVSERADVSRAPAMAWALTEALAAAGLEAAGIGMFDLYSCFPIAVLLAAEALGIEPDDARGVTLTGGMAAFGGPGNAYALHGAAAAYAAVVNEPAGAGTALVNGNGWYLTKHASLVLGGAPRAFGGVRRASPKGPQVSLAAAPEGAGVIEGHTVVFGPDGSPSRAIALGRLEAGGRFLAHVTAREVAARLAEESAVGARATVRPGTPVNEAVLV